MFKIATQKHWKKRKIATRKHWKSAELRHENPERKHENTETQKEVQRPIYDLVNIYGKTSLENSSLFMQNVVGHICLVGRKYACAAYSKIPVAFISRRLLSFFVDYTRILHISLNLLLTPLVFQNVALCSSSQIYFHIHFTFLSLPNIYQRFPPITGNSENTFPVHIKESCHNIYW